MIYTDEIINNPVKLSHYLIENRMENNIRACDMTAGNGKDSKFILDKKPPPKFCMLLIYKNFHKKDVKNL